jgi:glycosyltransferase involved in cell wall biosynthesis
MAAEVAVYLGVGMEKMRVIRTAVSQVAEAPRPQPGGIFTVGYLSVIRPAKGLDLLVDALRILVQEEKRRVQLLIGGRVLNAHFWKDVQKMISKAGLESAVEFVGEVDGAGKAPFMGRIDVFSVPSRYSEPRGVAVLEAMAAGVPVVVPNTGIYPELLAMGGGGLMVTPQDSIALARGIAELMDDPERLAKLGREARELVMRHCSVEEMVDRTVAEYQRLVG